MKQLLFLLLFLIPLVGVAQVGDLPDAKPLKIEAANKLDKDGKKDKGTALRIPDVIKEQPKINFKDSLQGRRPVKMVDDRNLVQAGSGLKIVPRFLNPEKSGSKERYDDIDLGEISTDSEMVGITLRDHGLIDGDRIKIWINGEEVHPNILILGYHKAINIELDMGVNVIEFESISEGSVPPNSAEIKVYDIKENLLYNNYWGLSNGSRAVCKVVRIPDPK